MACTAFNRVYFSQNKKLQTGAKGFLQFYFQQQGSRLIEYINFYGSSPLIDRTVLRVRRRLLTSDTDRKFYEFTKMKYDVFALVDELFRWVIARATLLSIA